LRIDFRVGVNLGDVIAEAPGRRRRLRAAQRRGDRLIAAEGYRPRSGARSSKPWKMRFSAYFGVENWPSGEIDINGLQWSWKTGSVERQCVSRAFVGSYRQQGGAG
jgi:hypothetical protein